MTRITHEFPIADFQLLIGGFSVPHLPKSYNRGLEPLRYEFCEYFDRRPIPGKDAS